MRVLVAHADLTARGGAEAYATAVVSRLRALGHTVGVLDINGLQSGNRIIRPRLFGLGRLPLLRRLSLWKYALVCRALPRIACAFDAVILTYGEGPATGRQTLRILHAPALFSLYPGLLCLLGARPPYAPRQLYAAICRFIARPVAASARTRTLANSRWTARIAARVHGGPRPAVLYPKVCAKPAGEGPRDPSAMVAVGRIVPNKRLEDAIAVTDALRARGIAARLTVIGRADTAYARRLIARHAGHPHVTFLKDASDTDLCAALARARIGLHFYRHEHFGIAIGEMITAGLIPLVHDGGGARELVPFRALRFRNLDEVIRRAETLISASDTAIAALRADLRGTDALTRAVGFEAAADAALDDFLQAL